MLFYKTFLTSINETSLWCHLKQRFLNSFALLNYAHTTQSYRCHKIHSWRYITGNAFLMYLTKRFFVAYRFLFLSTLMLLEIQEEVPQSLPLAYFKDILTNTSHQIPKRHLFSANWIPSWLKNKFKNPGMKQK